MAELLLGVSQSSLLLLQPKLGLSNRASALRHRSNISYQRLDISSKRIATVAGVVSSDSKSSTILSKSVDTVKDGSEIVPEIGGGGGGGEKFGSGGGGGGGGGGEGKNEGEGESSDESENKKMGMSMSQKLTLGYAALVGVGGLMGYLKSGSQKSLLAGGVSASLLYYVYTELPTKPVLASSIGLGLSAALLVVMGSRFKKSGKVFPAGVVSLVSLVMTGGYLHGIMRSMH
ncbi:protein FATTY ACID EXPORT 2, chloroplastic [Pistacia vera]|uniref:protein FATTY ACID EXPORT 2, chloroplastic n=1 Tax=Pistacia vera TaxID=55513 RepID=UPI001262F444|nr:protein FATTY ACID EXPORT 2, chloroplastic [Pistacia vera]